MLRGVLENEIFINNKPKKMKKFFQVFVAVSALLVIACKSNAQTADDIIAKYINAIGGADNIKKINSVKADIALEVQGLSIPFVMQAVNDKGFRMQGEFQGNSIIEIITPTQGWSQNPLAGKATMQPATEDELREKLDRLDIQDPFLDYQAKGSTVEYLGKDEEDGNQYHKIKMMTKNKNETTYFFDENTGLIYKEETIVKQEGQEIKSEAKRLDYQMTEIGVKMPFKVDQGGMMLVTKKITFNPSIDEAIFSAK